MNRALSVNHLSVSSSLSFYSSSFFIFLFNLIYFTFLVNVCKYWAKKKDCEKNPFTLFRLYSLSSIFHFCFNFRFFFFYFYFLLRFPPVFSLPFPTLSHFPLFGIVRSLFNPSNQGKGKEAAQKTTQKGKD